MGEEHPLQVARCTKIIPGSISIAAAAAAAREAGASSGSNGSGPAGANGDTSANGSSDASGSGSGSGSGGRRQPPPASAAAPGGGLGSLAAALGGGERKLNADEKDKYVINVKQIAKFVVELGDKVASTDIEEGMRVGWVPGSTSPHLHPAMPYH